MNRWALISNLKDLVEKMQPGLLDSGVKEGYLDFDETKAQVLPDDFINEAYMWLNVVYDLDYREWARARRNLPEDLWKRYEAWGGFEDFREVKILNRARAELKQAITTRKRPDFFKKGKYNEAVKRGEAEYAAKTEVDDPSD